MKKAFVWFRDYIAAPLIVFWIGTQSFDGFLSKATQSWHSLGIWTLDPIAVPRWQLLLAMVGVMIYGAGTVIYVIRAQRRTDNSVAGVITTLTTAFTDATQELESTPSISAVASNTQEAGVLQGSNIALAMELTQLEPEQRAVLEYLARRYESNKKYASGHEVGKALRLSALRAEQLLDQLLALGMIKTSLSTVTGKTFYLASVGREWLLANGYA